MQFVDCFRHVAREITFNAFQAPSTRPTAQYARCRRCRRRVEKLNVIRKRCLFPLILIATAMVANGQQGPLPGPSRIDLFAGYSYWQANGSAGGSAFSNGPQGLLVSGAYYLDRNFGLELVGDYHFTGGNDSMRSASIGPVWRGKSYHGFTPFVHGLAGATNMLGPGAFYSGRYEPQAATWGRQITFGGGVDYSTAYFHHHLKLRLFQADYVLEHVDFGAGGLADFNSGRFSTGLLWRWGTVPPAPPVTLACTAAPQTVFRGDPLSVIGVATNLDQHRAVTFRWSGPGVPMNALKPVVEVETSALEPGTYTITGHMSEGNRSGQSADCTARFTVRRLPQPESTH
jgi:hypothetical protein